MSKQFIKGNVYVFTKKKFTKHMGKKELQITRRTGQSWVDEVNGNEVENGNISCYGILPKWCKCIKNNPKFKSEVL